MAAKEKIESLLREAYKNEQEYDWLAAIEPYETALNTTAPNDLFKAAKLSEKVGNCYYRAAMQAHRVDEYRSSMRQAIDAYNDAAKFSSKAENPEMVANANHCTALALYFGSWLEYDHDSRLESLTKCFELEKEALKLYEKPHDCLEMGKVYNAINTCLIDLLDIDWDRQTREEMLREARDYSEKAIDMLVNLKDERELARAYCLSSALNHVDAMGFEEGKQNRCRKKALEYSKKAVELSEKVGDQYLISLSSIWLGSSVADFTVDQISAKKHFEKALQNGLRTRDNYLIGRSSYLLAHLMCWVMFAQDDPEKKRKEAGECKKYSEEAYRHFSAISREAEIASSYYCSAENYSVLAMSAETNLNKRRLLLGKSIVAGRKGLEFARRSGSISAQFILHPLSKSLFYLATLETDIDERKHLLQEALQFRKQNIEALELATPCYFWNQGVYNNYLALIEAELANLEESKEDKIGFLENAIQSAQKCISLCLKSEPSSYDQHAALGKYYFHLGDMLNRLYQLTNADELLTRLLTAFEGALQTYEKAKSSIHVAESYWQLANTLDQLHRFTDAADKFELAHENYVRASKKIPSLKKFYLNHASYMKAWSEIEHARFYHEREEFGVAEKHYENAAGYYESSGLLKYLAPNYFAWSQLERGENLSREELCKEAKLAFQKARKLFLDAKTSIDKAASENETNEEKEQRLMLSQASAVRSEYCHGRILLEDAKIDDKQSRIKQSADNYCLAAKVFLKMTEALEEGSERDELRSMAYFCQAWEKMKLAEQKVSSELFIESSELFNKAKDYTTKEKTSLLAMGNSAFCKALSAGTEFEATQDNRLYSIAKKSMETASNYYLKAGFEKASVWVNANQVLLDAYVYVGKAETDTDTEKKIRDYELAEKYLQRSSELYAKAGYTGKTEEVTKVLANVKEKREFALSLDSVLKPPALASSTAAFSVPSSAQEEAVGIEKFDHANVQAHLTAPNDAIVEQPFEIRLDLTNVAKEPGLLVRIENLLPSNFKPTETFRYKIEESTMEINGKRLDPQAFESFKIRVKASQSGVVHLNPKIVYIDELGKFKVCQPDPATINVYSPGEFQFKTTNAQKAFDFLAKVFAEDYMKRRFPLDRSGWRSLMQIVKFAKVSKSSMYGTSTKRGTALNELIGRGVIETRIFPEERGRGGQITKARVAYEKDIIRRYIDEQIMKIKEK